jgi:hypothetical protein
MKGSRPMPAYGQHRTFPGAIFKQNRGRCRAQILALQRRSIASSIPITTRPVGSEGIQWRRNRKCNWPTPRQGELGHCHGAVGCRGWSAGVGGVVAAALGVRWLVDIARMSQPTGELEIELRTEGYNPR